ncbi:MAG TPA: ATP-binding protein, partial [Sphingomicrobium sp.]|nr:ATP-binding protein [Sphingomicrobium sp.]
MIFTLNRDKSRRLIEGLTEAAIIVRGATVVMSNRAARNLLGVAIENVDVRQVLPHPALIERLVRGRVTGHEEIEAAGFGGARRHWLVRISPLGEGDLLVRLIDRSEARAAEQMRVDFVANASHELRTPLSTLIGYTETLRERTSELDRDTQERFLSIVHDEARRMQRVVEDLISLSRIEAEKFTTPTEAVDLEQLIEVSVESAKRMADERNSELITSIAPDLPPIAADATQILQVLDNLITNALRYGEPGTPVRVSATLEDEMVQVSVADRGEGIAPEHIKRLTERFYRVDTSRSRSLGGTGLGLSIVKHIVERHRGRLTIES